MTSAHKRNIREVAGSIVCLGILTITALVWALVFACDMFERFKEAGGMLDPEAGAYYRRRILARGGTIDGLELVREYLGREPQMDAYLKHLGLEP